MGEINGAIELLWAKLESWGRHLVLMLPNLFLALVLLIVTFYVARVLRGWLDKFINRFSHSVALNNLVSSLLYVAIVLIGFFFVLGILKLDKVVLSMLAGVGIIGLALGFAFQNIAANLLAGVIIAVQKPFNIGDMIETNEYFGSIERITLRSIDIRQVTGELVRLPNKTVFENPVTNFSDHHLRRVDLPGRVSYAEDLERVQRVVIEALQDVKGRVQTREVQVMYNEFGDSSINFEVRFWITYNRQVDYVGARSDAIIRMKKAFDAENILIPFPIRTLDFAIKGGENLTGQLEQLQGLVQQNGQQPEDEGSKGK